MTYASRIRHFYLPRAPLQINIMKTGDNQPQPKATLQPLYITLAQHYSQLAFFTTNPPILTCIRYNNLKY